MKKLFKLLAAAAVMSTTSLTLVSCFPKEVEVYRSDMGYEILSSSETDRQIPIMKKRIDSFGNPWMKGNITNDLYFNIKTEEANDMVLNSKLNERQQDMMIDSLSANLRVYKILNTDFTLNPKLFETIWSHVDEGGKKFSVDVIHNGEKFVTMKGEYFIDDTVEISEINENTFVQISDMAIKNQKIVTSPGMGAFWGVDFIGEKYSEEEQKQLWEPGGKYADYKQLDKQTMTWKNEQKISIDALKQTMTDYLSSRLRTSGTIQSNLEIDYDDVDISTTGFKGGLPPFECKASAENCTGKFNKTQIDKKDDNYYYFAEDSDFGATTLIDPSIPRIWYKTNMEHQIKQGGSIFQSGVEYKW